MVCHARNLTRGEGRTGGNLSRQIKGGHLHHSLGGSMGDLEDSRRLSIQST